PRRGEGWGEGVRIYREIRPPSPGALRAPTSPLRGEVELAARAVTTPERFQICMNVLSSVVLPGSESHSSITMKHLFPYGSLGHRPSSLRRDSRVLHHLRPLPDLGGDESFELVRR